MKETLKGETQKVALNLDDVSWFIWLVDQFYSKHLPCWPRNASNSAESGRAKRSGPEKLATSSEVFRAARSAVPCRSSASGHRASSKYTRSQSRETGSLSRSPGDVEAPAKCVSGLFYITKTYIYFIMSSMVGHIWIHLAKYKRDSG